MSWDVRLTAAAQADLRVIIRWLSQPGAGMPAHKKLDAIRLGIRGLGEAPLRYPVSMSTNTRKRSVSGGYEIHYDLTRHPPGSMTPGVVNVLFVKGPYQDYATFKGR